MNFFLQFCLCTTCVPGALGGPGKDTGFPELALQTLVVSHCVDANN